LLKKLFSDFLIGKIGGRLIFGLIRYLRIWGINEPSFAAEGTEPFSAMIIRQRGIEMKED
jgi:hypothetical protein